MVLEILGGAILGKALSSASFKKDKFIEKKTSTTVERYAVMFEVKRGKGNGAFGVVYLCSGLQEAKKWAENACTALINVTDKFDYWGVEPANEDNANILYVYTCSGADSECIYVVTKY